MAYINGLETMFSARIGSGLTAEEILEMVYPVGSVYISASATSPASFMGGTWEQLKDRFLVGAGSTYANGATGGEATHTLTVDEMPSHTHNYNGWAWELQGGSSGGFGLIRTNNPSTDANNFDLDGTFGTKATGGGASHNNMPPYLAVNMWKRIA